MTQDITERLQTAARTKTPVADPVAALADLATRAGLSTARVDLDEGAGENWATLQDRACCYAILHVKYPIAVLLNRLSRYAASQFDRQSVTLVSVDDMSSCSLCADPTVLESFGGRKVPHDFDVTSFSALDLFWLSV
jgi:hypothetical protein